MTTIINTDTPNIPNCLILLICEYLRDLDKILFLSSNKDLHKLKHLIWIDLDVGLEYLRRSVYKNRFRSVRIKISEIRFLEMGTSSNNYYDICQNINATNIQKIVFVLDSKSHDKFLDEENTKILSKLNVKNIIIDVPNYSDDLNNYELYEFTGIFPDTVTKLKIKHTIYKSELPKKLKYLSYDGPNLKIDLLPQTLIILKDIDPDKLDKFPTNLKKIKFDNYDHNNYIDSNMLPAGLLSLKRIKAVDYNKFVIPKTVKKITFYSIDVSVPNLIPDGIIHLRFECDINGTIKSKFIPETVKLLAFEPDRDRGNLILDDDAIPSGVNFLVFDFNISIGQHNLPIGLEYLYLLDNFDKFIDLSYSNLTKLNLPENYSHDITNYLPKTLTNLTISIHRLDVILPNVRCLKINSYLPYDDLSYVPSSVKKLSIGKFNYANIVSFIPAFISEIILVYFNDQHLNNLGKHIRSLKIIHGEVLNKFNPNLTELKISEYGSTLETRFIPKTIKKIKLHILNKNIITDEIRSNCRVSYYKST